MFADAAVCVREIGWLSLSRRWEFDHVCFAVIADSNFASVCAVISPAGDDSAIGEVNHADVPP